MCIACVLSANHSLTGLNNLTVVWVNLSPLIKGRLRHPALHDSMKVDSKKVATKGGDEGLADEVGGVVGELEEVRIGRLFPIFGMLSTMTSASMRHMAAG